jgi:hypothetical protein
MTDNSKAWEIVEKHNDLEITTILAGHIERETAREEVEN